MSIAFTLLLLWVACLSLSILIGVTIRWVYDRRDSIDVSQWNGRWSLRVHFCRLWLGGSLRTRALFVIWNGPSRNWQLQTWPPRLAKQTENKLKGE
jgi:hypothetical protein